MDNKRIIATKSGKKYEIRNCKECGTDLVKRKYESIYRYSNKKFCSMKCTRVYLKKENSGWFGHSIHPENKKKESKRTRDMAFMTAMRSIINAGDISLADMKKTRKVLANYERKYAGI